MAITKLGAQILGGIEKRGGSDRAPTPPPTIWKKMGQKVIGPAMSFTMPGLMAFGTANSIASGEQSLGGGLGELGGGIAGWSLGNKAFNSAAQKIKPIPAGGKAGIVRGLLGGTVGFLGSIIGGEAGSSVGNKILPFQRKPKNVQEYWQTGWNGQPDAY